MGEAPPLRGFRYGEGRILVFQATIARYCALLPQNSLEQGFDGADDRLLALHGLIWATAAGKRLPARIAFGESLAPVMAGTAAEFPIDFSGAKCDRVRVRIQDNTDTVHVLRDDLLDETGTRLRVPPLPAMHRYFLDVIALNETNECVGLGGTVLDVAPEYRIVSLDISPSQRNHEEAPPMVNMPEGGSLRVSSAVEPAPETGTLRAVFEIRDCVDRLVARAEAPVVADGQVDTAVDFLQPVVVPHRLDMRLLSGETLVATTNLAFTARVPYPYDDFTVLMWSYAGGDLTLRTENRLCYELGSDMMDLCHMRGYSDAGAAREYAVAAQSGQRMVPYVTRIAGTAKEDHTLSPSLFDDGWIERQRTSMEISCRQAAPYHPPAYTLGDENYLARDRTEVDVSPENVAAFNEWLRAHYPDIGALNAVWKTSYTSFDDIREPMLLDEAAEQTASFAPWFDFRLFMDTAFADLHETFAGFVRKEDAGAKVGWDGFLRYHWLAGYDFYKLTRNLELNQVYTTHPLQGELVRSFKRPDALTGEWGNAVADNEAGFSAINWHNLFRGHNSCWWWTSWGCDYIPFNPDMSISHMGTWFFDSAAEVKAGPGKLLLHGRRDDSGVAVLYNQADLFAAKLRAAMPHDAPVTDWRANLKGVMHALEDIGCQYSFVAAAEIETDPGRLDGYRVLVLPLATCMSDALVQAVRDFVQDGGVVIADGRASLLTGNGLIRDHRLLDDVLGVQLAAGLQAFQAEPVSMSIELAGESATVSALETNIETASGSAELVAEDVPYLIRNDFGKGHAVLLNMPFATVSTLRAEERERLLLDPLTQYLALGDVKPYAELKVDGEPARCIEQTLFVDGDLRYLCLQQDILHRSLEAQELTVTIDAPAYVYDVRKGGAVAQEPVRKWSATISRGYPLVYALLPCPVTEVSAAMDSECARGATLKVATTVKAEGAQPQYHFVHLDVFAPGSDTSHREYSQNIECPNGQGSGTIPFALNDPMGAWRLVFRDVASGAKTEVTIRLTRRP
ncbi:MAG: beta-galactosidase trimerization domain-containing protein [Candidatus Hydrogenedentota bacterium]